MIERRALPLGTRSVEFWNIQLPEFVNGKVGGGREARFCHSPECRNNITFRRDFLQASQMKFCFHTNTVKWLGVKLDIKSVDRYMIDDAIDNGLKLRRFYNKNIKKMHCSINKEELEDSEFQLTQVLDRTYSSVTAKEVRSQQTRLNKEE